ncbi:MAG: hypothetical protein H6734_15480 [Alphaproteobacteria bacterium]|nr:hypothetical protein [Alphaproteobacteria bacterium]
MFRDAFNVDGGRPGVVLPMLFGPFWGDRGLAVQAGGPTGLCAAIAATKVLVHELMHLCVDGENDGFSCWALQNMAATTFFLAMVQRYSCVRDNWCCFAPNATLMSSEEFPYIWGGNPFRAWRWRSQPSRFGDPNWHAVE